jgi:uncharacterized membrane protein YfcA
MDWTVYWFMLPVCVVVASVAMFSGISGAALLIPVFLIGFPLLDVPRLSTVEAIGTSLFLETSGFGTGLYRYLRRRLVDTATAWRLVALTLPLGMLGAVASARAPVQILRLGYAVVMIALGLLLVRESATARAPRAVTGPHPGAPSRPAIGRTVPSAAADSAQRGCPGGTARTVTTSDGETYDYCMHGIRGQQGLSGLGAFFAGLISTGVGEATLPGLVHRSRMPVAVAAATSTVVVAGTVVGAAVTHMVQLAVHGGLTAIPWNLIVWAVPGAVLGAIIGTGAQGRISPRVTRWFFAGLFFSIGATFLVAFTVFRSTFG